MGNEKFDKSNGVDPLEIKELVPVEAAAGELMDFLFNPLNGHPFGASQFTLDQLKERFFAQPREDIVTPLPPSAFPSALKYLCDNGLLGFNEESNTYYDKESA